jgi:hypothetical protein
MAEAVRCGQSKIKAETTKIRLLCGAIEQMDRERSDDVGIALKVNKIAYIIKKYKDEWRGNIPRKTEVRLPSGFYMLPLF